MWNLETGNTRLLALPHHKQAYQFEKQIISIINELGIWITCCWCWVLWLDLTHIKNSLLSVVGCLHIASSTCLLTAGIANRTEIGEHWDMAGGHLSAGPLWFKQGSGVHRPFLRATLLTHPPKPAMAGALQMLQAACCPVNATLPCCKEADPANPDRWKENQLSAFLTANFYRVGVPPPPFLQLLRKAVPILWTASGLSTRRWGAVPRAAEATAPVAAPGWWSLLGLKTCSAAEPPGMSVFSAAALCGWCAWLLRLPNPFCSASSPLHVCFPFCKNVPFHFFPLELCLNLLFSHSPPVLSKPWSEFWWASDFLCSLPLLKKLMP